VSVRVVAALLLLAVLWGSAFPGLKLALTDLSAGHLTLLQHLVASLCLVICLIIATAPAITAVVAFMLLGEVPSSLTLLGGLIAIGGIVLVDRSKVSKSLSHRRFAHPR
jgi:drug/metabolite transporter (DMT)-like permease